MTAAEIKDIIQIIPECITYIYPGYLTIFLFLFFRGRSIKEDNYVWLKAIAISYIYISFKPFFKKLLSWPFELDISKIPQSVKYNLYLLVLSIIVAYFADRIIVADKTQKILKFLHINTTFYDNEFEMLVDFDKGAWLCVYLKDEDIAYEGSLGYKEIEDGKRKYISLRGFRKYIIKDGKPLEPYIVDNSNEPQNEVVIFYDDIKRIEKM